MQKLTLNAQTREEKTKPRAIRGQGLMPAVLYGHNVKNQNLTINTVEFEKALKIAGESTIIDLSINDKNHPVLIQDVQLDNLSYRPMHADFYQVSMTEKLKANVVLEFIGESMAVKTLGGVLFKQLSEIQVECLPADLPHNFIVDISRLKTFNDTVLIKDLKVSDKVKILANSDEVVAKVQPPRDVEKELAPVATDEKTAVEATVAATDAEKAKAAAEKETVKEETK